MSFSLNRQSTPRLGQAASNPKECKMKAQALINTAEEVLASMREKGLLDESRTGGYMTIDWRDGSLTSVVGIGTLTDPEKIRRYRDFSM